MVWTQSYGFDGPIPEAQWSRMASVMSGVRGVVDDVGHWKVTPVVGERQITIAAGYGVGYGVSSRTDAADVLDIPTPVSGGRWYMIAVRRTFLTNFAEFVIIPADDLTTDAFPYARPIVFPSGYKRLYGDVVDQELAWVWASSTSNTLRVLDIRNTVDWIDYEPTSVNTADGWTYAPESYIRRRGNQVEFHLRLSRSSPIVGENYILTLPPSVVQFDDYASVGALVSGGNRGIVAFSVTKSDGAIRTLYESNPNATQMRLEFSYLLT